MLLQVTCTWRRTKKGPWKISPYLLAQEVNFLACFPHCLKPVFPPESAGKGYSLLVAWSVSKQVGGGGGGTEEKDFNHAWKREKYILSGNFSNFGGFVVLSQGWSTPPNSAQLVTLNPSSSPPIVCVSFRIRRCGFFCPCFVSFQPI